MASAPLNWLLKIGSAALKTTEQTLTGAVNELKDLISSSQSQADSQFSAVAADMSKKVNKTDVLNLEEIEATTNLTDKVAAAEAVKEVNDSLGGLSFGYDETEQKYGYWKKEADTEVFVPFKGSIEMATITNTTNGSINQGTGGASTSANLTLTTGTYIILASVGGGSGRTTDHAAHPAVGLVKPVIASGNYNIIQNAGTHYILECIDNTVISASASVSGWASSWFNAITINLIAIKISD